MSGTSTGTNSTGLQTIVPGTMVQPGPILSGQALRAFETVANAYDPRVTGLARPVGSRLFTRDGTISFLKIGSGNTDWMIISGGFPIAAPLTLLVNDVNNNTAPDLLVLRKTTSGGAGAVGQGVTLAVELESEASNVPRVMTDVTTLTGSVDVAEVAQRKIRLMGAGALADSLTFNPGGVAVPAGTAAAPGLVVGTQGLYHDTVNAALSGAVGSSQQWLIKGTQLWLLGGSAQLVLSSAADCFIQRNGSAAMLLSALTGGVIVNGRFEEKQGAAVASASTLTLGADGNYFHITGATTINYITTTNWQAGVRVELYFDGAPTVTHNAGAVPGSTNAIQLVGAVNLAAAAGSKLTLRLDSTLTKWVEVSRSGA